MFRRQRQTLSALLTSWFYFTEEMKRKEIGRAQQRDQRGSQPEGKDLCLFPPISVGRYAGLARNMRHGRCWNLQSHNSFYHSPNRRFQHFCPLYFYLWTLFFPVFQFWISARWRFSPDLFRWIHLAGWCGVRSLLRIAFFGGSNLMRKICKLKPVKMGIELRTWQSTKLCRAKAWARVFFQTKNAKYSLWNT